MKNVLLPAVPETKINEGQVWPNFTDYAMNNSVVALPDNTKMRASQTQQLSEKEHDGGCKCMTFWNA